MEEGQVAQAILLIEIEGEPEAVAREQTRIENSIKLVQANLEASGVALSVARCYWQD